MITKITPKGVIFRVLTKDFFENLEKNKKFIAK